MTVNLDRHLAVISSAVANLRRQDDRFSDDLDVVDHEIEAIKERCDKVDEHINELLAKITEAKIEIYELEETSGGFEKPELTGWNENLDHLKLAIVSRNLHDQLKLKALSNLFRNLSLEDIEGLDRVSRHKHKMTKKSYVTFE